MVSSFSSKLLSEIKFNLKLQFYGLIQGDLDLHEDEGLPAFLLIKIYQKFQKKVLTSFEDL